MAQWWETAPLANAPGTPENEWWKTAPLQEEFAAPAVPSALPEPNLLERLGQVTGSTITGLGQGATMGAYDEVASALGIPIKGIENIFSGRDSIGGPGDILPFLGRSFMDAREGQQALVNQAYEQAPIAAGAGDVAGALGLGLLSGGSNVASIARPSILGMAGRGGLEGGLQGGASGFNAAQDASLEGRLKAAAQGAVGGGVLGALTGGVVGGSMARQQHKAVPTVKELFDDAEALYTSARTSGKAASPQQSTEFANHIMDIAKAESLVGPKTGAIDTSYPHLAGFVNMMNEYGGEVLDVGRLQSLRRRLTSAAGSSDSNERRIAMSMLDDFDNLATSIAPELEDATNLYWRAKTGELIERLGKLADVRASQYSQSGIENGLRAEFRALERRIINGKVRGLPQELVDQIGAISRGDSLQDAARWASRFSLKNPLTALGGTAAGFATGSFPVAAGVWAGAQGAGMLASKMARDKYAIAAALARNGGALPSVPYSPTQQALIQSAGNLAGRFSANFGQ